MYERRGVAGEPGPLRRVDGDYPVEGKDPGARAIRTRIEPVCQELSYDYSLVHGNSVTSDHIEPVVDHSNRAGRDMSRKQRNDWFNMVGNLRPMERTENARLGALLRRMYEQETGSNYSS